MINIELLKLLMEIKHKINITMRYLNKLKEIINDWFRDKTMEQYEKYLLNNKGKKCRFHIDRGDYGIIRLKFNAESKHGWITFIHFYCSSTEEKIEYYEQTFGNESVNEFIETHSMIDDILKEFERDKERIAREIQRQKDYKRSYNIY